MKNILIIDTQAGNLFSLKAAIERLGMQCHVSQRPGNEKYDGIVIPGQGRFAAVMTQIRKNHWDVYLENARQQNIPILGICVGMQIFFEASDEDPQSKGLAWFNGRVEKLKFPKAPMVGWAKLQSKIWPKACVYFVNSYAVRSADDCIATTFYGEEFCVAIRKNCFTGVQFHPEKSDQIGAKIIYQSLTETAESTLVES